MEQEGRKWKGEHSRGLPIIHIASAQTASPRKLPQAPPQATTKTASEQFPDLSFPKT